MLQLNYADALYREFKMKIYKLFIATAACLFTMASYAGPKLYDNTLKDISYYCVPSGAAGHAEPDGSIVGYCNSGDYGVYFGAYDSSLTLAQIQAITVHTLSYDGPQLHYFDYFEISQGQAAVLWGLSDHTAVGFDGDPYSSLGVCATAQGPWC
jgi:hypothetical protein